MLLCNIFPQFRSLAGGERLALKISNLMVKKGHKVTLLTLSMNKSCRQELHKEVRLIEVVPILDKIKNHYMKVFLEHIFAWQLAKFIPKETERVCFHKSSSLPALFHFKRIRKSNIPSIYFCYEPPRLLYDLKEETIARLGIIGILITPFFPLFKFLDLKWARAADSVIVFSKFMKGEVEKLYNRNAKLIGPLGIDLPNTTYSAEVRAAFKEKWQIGERDKVIITVNKLHPRKRIDILIKAIPKVLEKYDNIKVLIIGIGPEELRLKELVKRLELERVIKFLGFVEERELPIYYSIADLYIHLAKNEPFGLTVLEALSFGNRVISVKEGGPEEVIKEGETGLFIQPSPEDLAEKIVQLLSNEKLMREMLKNTQEIKGSYNWNNFIDRFIAACQDLKGL